MAVRLMRSAAAHPERCGSCGALRFTRVPVGISKAPQASQKDETGSEAAVIGRPIVVRRAIDLPESRNYTGEDEADGRGS
jgi:hypothetical protein